MKKIKNTWRKMRSGFSVKVNKRPGIFIIFMMVAINLVILVIASFLALWIDPSFTSFLDAFINGSVKWMLTPNALLLIENTKTLILASVVFIIGLVLFSGIIIALITNSVKDYFAKKNAFVGKMHLENHVVVLNWNEKVPEIVADMLYIDEEDPLVVILADVEKTYVEKHVKNAVLRHAKSGVKMQKINVIVKQVDPMLKSELEDISIEHAKSILIMSPPHSKEKQINYMNQSDLDVTKQLLVLREHPLKSGCSIIVEVKTMETKKILEDMSHIVDQLKDKRIIPICFDRRLGQILAQTTITPMLEQVYFELFSFEGSEVYALMDSSVDEVITNHSHVVPVAHIAPYTYVLAEKDSDKWIKRQSIKSMRPKYPKKQINERIVMDVVILGNNNKRPFVLETFKDYETLYQSDFHVSMLENDHLKEGIKSFYDKDRDQKILILSDEGVKMHQYDANVILALLDIRQSLATETLHVVAEVLDPKNDNIVKSFNIKNTIISNKTISLLITKLALFPETGPFYDALLTVDPNHTGVNQCATLLLKASDVFDHKGPYTFESVTELLHTIYYGSNKIYTIIGYIDQNVTLFKNNLDTKKVFTLSADTTLVLVRL